MLLYQDKSKPLDNRLDDLLSRMSLEQKLGELMQLSVRGDMMPTDQFERDHVGSYAFAIGDGATEWQRRAEKRPLSIPALSALDAIHGHALYPRAAIFPSQLAVSCSWNPALVERMGRVTAVECRATGVHWTFSPVLDVARDIRWGRINETFGEDTFLVGELGVALVKGYQGTGPGDPEGVLATAKHFAGYPDTQGGRDASESDITRRKLMTYFLPPFEKAIKAGCATIMTAYHSIDGTVCTANHWLLTELLREQWGFEGVVTTDAGNVWYMLTNQFVCASEADGTATAIRAGNDIINCSTGFQKAAKEALEKGLITEEEIGVAARRVLRLKFLMGLFDNQRHHDPALEQKVVGCAEHRAATLQAAEQSLVLLKNGGMLPLSKDVKKLAVIGPNADDPVAQLGDWVLGANPWESPEEKQPREHIVTVLDALKKRARLEVSYARGCDIMDPANHDIEAAVALAKAADAVVIVLGDTNHLNGEMKDRADLNLSGAQQHLLESVYAVNKRVVLVLICGKPLTIPWAAQHIPAIICAFNPGMEGGTAVAKALFGESNPSGKLTISWPRHVGQLPVFYNQLPGWHAKKYADMTVEPQWPFGHGLSYTSFAYDDVRVNASSLTAQDTLTVTVRVTNTGSRAGTEIVQLYVDDVVSSVTTPVKELKAFARVALEAGESKQVELSVPVESLALVTPELERVVEPGEFEIMVGGSSRDGMLMKTMVSVLGASSKGVW
jgi:beta-glucosidase